MTTASDDRPAADRRAADVPGPDPGLFGPQSLTWRVHADPAMALGGLRALMLQAVHPLAMAGVAQHSDYQTDPWGRLQRTAAYVATVTYGTTDEANRAAARVRSVHGPLAGIEPESGTPYRVADPRLLTWVHCAEADSFLAAYLRCGGALAPGEADAYLAEQVRAAALVGVDPATCPSSVAELQAYFEAVRPQLRVTAEARRALWFMLNPPMPLAARPPWAGLAATAFGLLPRWARRLYGVVGATTALPGAELAAGASARSLHRLARLVPERVRESPAHRSARRRVKGLPPEPSQA